MGYFSFKHGSEKGKFVCLLFQRLWGNRVSNDFWHRIAGITLHFPSGMYTDCPSRTSRLKLKTLASVGTMRWLG